MKIFENINTQIDLDYLFEKDMTFDILEEAVHIYIYEQEIIYYYKAMEYLAEKDNSLSRSMDLASDLGYTTEDLNSELLATLLYQDNLLQQWNEICDEVKDLINGL